MQRGKCRYEGLEGQGAFPARSRACQLGGGLPARRGALPLPPVSAWLSSMSANSSRDVMPPSRRMETQFLLSIW